MEEPKDYQKIQEDIEALIEEFASSHPEEHGWKPIVDGISYPEFYARSRPKILFVLKEAYDYANGEQGEGGWHLKELGDNIIDNVTTHRRVSYICTMIHENILYNDDWSRLTHEDRVNYFKSIAWINVGKFPAPNNSKTDDRQLKKCYDLWKEILLKQIEAYDPDIIIFGNTFKPFLSDPKLKDSYEPLEKEWSTHFYQDKKKGRLLVYAYHPSVREGTVKLQKYCDSILEGIRKFDFKNKPDKLRKG